MSKQMNLLSEEQGTPLFSQPVERQPFAHARVEASSVEDFIQRYYKKDRLFDDVYPGYTDTIIENRLVDVVKYGYCIISRHESVTGQVVAYFPA